MKAFEFDSRLIDRYATFSRSFTEIRAEDLKSVIETKYSEGRFWPESLLSLNPRFKTGPSIDDLVSSGDLDDSTGAIFRFGPSPLLLHRHQAQALAKAKDGQSYVVTTGTGSGKSAPNCSPPTGRLSPRDATCFPTIVPSRSIAPSYACAFSIVWRRPTRFKSALGT